MQRNAVAAGRKGHFDGATSPASVAAINSGVPRTTTFSRVLTQRCTHGEQSSRHGPRAVASPAMRNEGS
jgi:hypothetical protein